jgi:hypothetical protein
MAKVLIRIIQGWLGWLDCGFQQGATIIKQTATAMHELNTLIHSLHRVNIGVAALVYGVGHDMS